MGPFYFSVNIDNAITLSIAPITDERIVQSGQELADTSGYFLVQTDSSQTPNDVRIMAHILSEDAALEISSMLNMQ